MIAVVNGKTTLPRLESDGRMTFILSGNHFQQNIATLPNNNYGIINIYCFYKLDPIASTRDTSYTIQSFDERSQFGHTITENGHAHTTNGRNVLIFGADMSFSTHATNRANHIYLMGDGLTQGINDTTTYAKKKYWRNFTDPGKKFVLSLHYNGDNSYLFVNGRQELKFKCKTDQLVSEKLCIGNLSDQWTTSESEKTGLYGNIYEFAVDYKQISGVKPIDDMHRYLIIKHDINPCLKNMYNL